MSIKYKDKVPQVLIACQKCGKHQYVRIDSRCCEDTLCGRCEHDKIVADNMPQAPA